MVVDEIDLGRRSAFWFMAIEMMRRAHRVRFPKRPFGPDIPLFMAFGAAVVIRSRRKPLRAASLARYLEIPRETARRHLASLTALGQLERRNGTHMLSESASHALPHIDSYIKLVADAAAKIL